MIFNFRAVALPHLKGVLNPKLVFEDFEYWFRTRLRLYPMNLGG